MSLANYWLQGVSSGVSSQSFFLRNNDGIHGVEGSYLVDCPLAQADVCRLSNELNILCLACFSGTQADISDGIIADDVARNDFAYRGNLAGNNGISVFHDSTSITVLLGYVRRLAFHGNDFHSCI